MGGHGWGWDRTNPAPSLAGILGFPAVKSPVAAGDRSLSLSTPAQLDASTGFVVPLTMAEQPQEIPGSLVVSPACSWFLLWDELLSLSCPDSPNL